MNHVLSIAKKELRAYFLSPVAFIFLGAFLGVNLFVFFWVESFFNRNIADIRPLFSWLPILLIFLCSALTMRLWSEEQKLGTLEILFTLPVRTHHLVIGKFLAALGLVAVALVLTFAVPMTVSMLGDLDWGPVFGGYLAALLLAGAYLAVGLTISAMTENQILALMGSTLLCSAFYVVGADFVTSNANGPGGDLLRALGTGSHFEGIRRGVVDVRDLVYYGSIMVSFLAINTVLLMSKGWSEGSRTARMRMNASVMAGLIALNAVGINVLLAPVGSVRVDLTERGEYSVSPVTKQMLRGLSEPLLIRGYFSSKTHPFLDPLVPRIKDMLEEYSVVAKGKVQVEFLDPREDEEIEKEANQLYAIKSFPFRISDRHDDAVVNSYFSILVKYGDEFEVLSFGDLIEVKMTGMATPEVKLRNLEYDLTRAVKKVAYGFQTLDGVFADLTAPAELYAFITPETLPQNYAEVPKRLEKVCADLKAQSNGKFQFEVIDPTKEGAKETRQSLYQKYGFKPFAVSLFSQESFYLHILLEVGDQYQAVNPGESMAEADIKKEVVSALERATPGFLKTVGLAKPKEEEQPDLPPQLAAQRPPPTPDLTKLVSEQLRETYEVKDVDLTTGHVPGEIDVLVVYAPQDYDDRQQFAVDQFLMRGGTVILLAGRYEIDAHASSMGGVQMKKVRTGLEDVLAAYGVEVKDELVLDPQNEPFPIPVTRNLGGLKIREVQFVDYPFFVDIRSNGMSAENPVVAGLPGVTMQWASPITVTTPTPKEPPKEGEAPPKRSVEVLLQSSDKAWTQTETEVQPDFDKWPKVGFGTDGGRKRHDLAVVLTGTFDSAFLGKKDPTATGEGGRVLARSPESARLVVFGSSSFVNDMVLSISRQTGSDRFTNNLQLVQNLVDWGVEDVELLTIRSRGTYARTLLPEGARSFGAADSTYELANYGFVVVALAVMAAIAFNRRRSMRPLDLDPDSKKVVKRPNLGQGATEAS
jgi:ABC-2 type transport system permease protein